MIRLKYKILIGIVLSIIWTGGKPLLAATVDCDLRVALVNLGTFVPFSALPEYLRNRALFENQQRYSFFIFGTEGRTANSYLVKDETGMPLFKYKYYLRKNVNPPPDVSRTPEGDKKSDQIAFEEIVRAAGAGIDIGFDVSKTYNFVDSRISKLEIIPGTDLLSILRDPKTPQSVKKSLIHIFNSNVDKFVNNFVVKIPTRDKFLSMSDGGLLSFKTVGYSPKGEFRIRLVPENIIVDLNSFKMTIIDPN